MKRISVCNLLAGVDRILLPQTTSISTASVASPNIAWTSVTATDSSFTVDVDNDLDIESVDTEDSDNDTPAPREHTSVHVDDIKPQKTKPVKLGTSKKTTIGFYTMKTQALRTPRVLIPFDDDDDDDDEEKPPPNDTRKLQDALEQPLQEPGSVQGHLRTGLLSLYLKTANVKTIPHEPQVTADRAKTILGNNEEITPISRKTDKFVPSTAEKETMDVHKAMFVDLFTSFSETHSAQPYYVKSVGDTDTQTSVVTTTL